MNVSQPQPSTGVASGPPVRPVVIAFATQKGGMGKTTLSVLVASTLHYRRGINVAILDVDGAQLSVYNQRIREAKQLQTDEDAKARFQAQIDSGIQPFTIKAGNPEQVPALLRQLPNDVQLVLLDMPGNIDVEGYETAIKTVDFLIVPMETSEYSVTTGVSYINAIREIELLPIDKLRVIWNKYKPSRDADMADMLESRFQTMGLSCLKSRVPQRDSYQDSINRSTLFPMPANYLRNSGLKDLFTEIELLTSLNSTTTNDD